MSFWLSIAAFVVVAVVFLLWPLWRREGGNERIWVTAGLLGILPALAIGLYVYLGAPAILKEQALLQARNEYNPEAMMAALEAKLKAQPNDAEGWYALGRAHIAMQRYADAEAALDQAVQHAPAEALARMLAQQAEAIALNSGSLQGRPLELAMAALAIDVEEEKALELAGLAAYQADNLAEALVYWRRLLRKLPPGVELHDAVSQAVAIAERRLKEKLEGAGVSMPPAPAEPKKSPH